MHLPFQLCLAWSFGVVRRRFHIVSYHTDVTLFALSDQRLRELALDAIDHAKSLGASDASCEVSESTGLSVSVRKKKVETIERTRDKGLGITVYIGKRRGNASTSDFARPALQQAVEAAYNIARFTADDDAAGLPDADTLQRSPRDLDLFHPWSLETSEAIKLAQRCEAAAFAVSPQIVNSEGANVYTSSGALRACEYAAIRRWLFVFTTLDLGRADRARSEGYAARRLVHVITHCRRARIA